MSNYITPSLKRALRGKSLKPITEDYSMKEVNSLITALLGKPGVGAGKAQRSLDSQIASGNSASAYGSAQMDEPSSCIPSSRGSVGSSSGGWIAAVIGLVRDVIGMFYNRKTDSIAYNRQNDFYSNHLSTPAKVEEYEEAGLNPMGLAGAGAGATSAPSVQATAAPALDGLTSMLGGLLSYKAQMARVEVDRERVQAQKEDIASRIEYRAEQKLYQQKINEWFDTNQIVSIDKAMAETQLALERVNSEQMKQKLDEAGISEKQANAALSFQLSLQKEFENSPEFRANTLALQRARSSEANANAAQTYEVIKNLASQRDEIASRIALNYANTDVGKQQLINLGLNAEQIEFAVKHQKGDLVFNRINQITSSLKDIGIATGGVAGLMKVASM